MTSHKKTSWFSRASEFNGVMDQVYTYGIKYLHEYKKEMFSKNLHLCPQYHANYIPNPFRYQYDLTFFIWLNFYKILKKEVKILRDLRKKEKNECYDDLADEILSTGKIYGISRSDFLFAAADFRWPTTELENGSLHGLMIRDPWSERRVAALSDEKIKYVFSFGGGGQGKTHVSIAFSLMVFDHFIFTQKGARCMISTTSEDKLNSVAWSYLGRLNSSTEKGISLYAGKAKQGGNFTFRRPNNKDTAGVLKGILIGNQLQDNRIVDKLTGSHGHPFIVYTIDEMQSTPSAPLKAAPNFTMHAKDYRINGAGNWGDNHDTLANNVKPDNGWNSVTSETGQWISTSQTGSKAICLHFNNELSPGMTEEGHRKFPHLPSQKILKEKYQTAESRDPARNESYRRFWIGWRVESSGSKYVIYDKLVRENLADQPLDLSSISHKFFAFDSAQAEIDRNPDIIFHEGICNLTKQRVFGPNEIILLNKSTDSLKYYQESANQLYQIAMRNQITSGSGVVDWTGRPAQAELLNAKGFQVRRLIYNKGVPDGKRRDTHTQRIEREIRLNIQLDFKNDIPAENVCAHHVAENNISLGAWALREYIKAGRVRGLNENLIKHLNNPRSFEEEVYYREFRLKSSTAYGERFHLEPKKEFKEKYGFSPDILDCLFQAAWYMLIYRNLPLTPITSNDIIPEKKEEEDTSSLWEQDDIFAF